MSTVVEISVIRTSAFFIETASTAPNTSMIWPMATSHPEIVFLLLSFGNPLMINGYNIPYIPIKRASPSESFLSAIEPLLTIIRDD